MDFPTLNTKRLRMQGGSVRCEVACSKGSHTLGRDTGANDLGTFGGSGFRRSVGTLRSTHTSQVPSILALSLSIG